MELIHFIILIYIYYNYNLELLIKLIIIYTLFLFNILNIKNSVIIIPYNYINNYFIYYRNFILLLPFKYLLKLLFNKFKKNSIINVKKLNNKKDINNFLNKLKLK